MKLELSSSYHARGKGLPATVSHMSPRSQSGRSLKFWKMGVPEEGFVRRCVIRAEQQSGANASFMWLTLTSRQCINMAWWKEPRYMKRPRSKTEFNPRSFGLYKPKIYLRWLRRNKNSFRLSKSPTTCSKSLLKPYTELNLNKINPFNNSISIQSFSVKLSICNVKLAHSITSNTNI